MNLLKSRSNVITYTVNKSEVSNCYISVQNGEVMVCAPWYLTANQIQTVVEEKKQWIIAKLKEYQTPVKAKLTSTETIKVLGKDYAFKIIYKNVKGPAVSLEEETIKIVLPNKYKKSDLAPVLKVLVEKMYFALAEKEVESAMEKARITLGFAPEDYEICKMQNTLGKCLSNKKILINPDIVMFSKNVIEYIVMHEFCHLKYKTHTKGFYSLLEKAIPNYSEMASLVKNYQY